MWQSFERPLNRLRKGNHRWPCAGKRSGQDFNYDDDYNGRNESPTNGKSIIQRLVGDPLPSPQHDSSTANHAGITRRIANDQIVGVKKSQNPSIKQVSQLEDSDGSLSEYDFESANEMFPMSPLGQGDPTAKEKNKRGRFINHKHPKRQRLHSGTKNNKLGPVSLPSKAGHCPQGFARPPAQDIYTSVDDALVFR